jgi:hypothetical protein
MKRLIGGLAAVSARYLARVVSGQRLVRQPIPGGIDSALPASVHSQYVHSWVAPAACRLEVRRNSNVPPASRRE